MSDHLIREFRAQLTTSMDSVLRAAMFEIMKIFENSLHDHQLELAQKGEEIAQLKIKLQRTEIKLKERECGDIRRTEMNKTVTDELQREPENFLSASGQTSEVPEIDFEVPDDWCAPLGCETVNKQEDAVCPSVRLRQLYIPLWHVPVIKQEVNNRDIECHQRTKHNKRSKRVPSLKESHTDTQDSSLMPDEGPRRPILRNDVKILLQDIKQECTDPAGLKRGEQNSTEKEPKSTLKSKREERKIAATESKSTEQKTVGNNSVKRYSCKFCKKEFDTLFGRSVHVRSHKRCRGCKKEFPFPSALKCHKPNCAKFQRLLSKETQSTAPPKPQPCDEEKPAAPSKDQEIIEKEGPPSSSSPSKSSANKNTSSKTHCCPHCNKQFSSRCRMQEHMRVHTGEKPFSCSLCSKKFRINQSLKLHIMRIHKGQVDASETNGGLSWTMPLEVIEDNQEDLISPSKDTSPAISHDKDQAERKTDKKHGTRWQTMGRRCPNGYVCLLCQKVMRNKYLLTEHFRIHTGEKPYKCDSCLAKFHSCALLGSHKKRCGNHLIQCEKCNKKFPSQTRYDKHVHTYHKDWTLFCKVCGKGFFMEGHLRNHMERHK